MSEKISNNMNKDFFVNYNYSEFGEMLPYERYKLFNWVKEFNIKNILEIGSGSGASTYYMANASNGKVYTCDPGRRLPEKLLKDFKNIEYFESPSEYLIDKIINEEIEIDYVFFDGPEIPELAISDILKLEKYLKDGCLFSMHDWETTKRNYDNGISVKCSKIRPYMESSEKWQEVEILSGLRVNSDFYVFENVNADSVGLSLYRYNSNK